MPVHQNTTDPVHSWFTEKKKSNQTEIAKYSKNTPVNYYIF